MIFFMGKSPILQVKIDNKSDVELIDFVRAMNSINDQYQRFVTQKKKKRRRPDCKLMVNKVSEGSIIIDILEEAPTILPIVSPLIVEYGSFMSSTMDYLIGKAKRLPDYIFQKQDFENLKSMLDITAKFQGNSFTFTGLNFGTTVVNNHYTHTEAKAAQNQCDREQKKLEESGDSLFKKNVNLRLYQARNSALSKSTHGNLGVIDELTSEPKVLNFENDKLRLDVTQGEENPLNFTYTVDIEIVLKEGVFKYSGPNDIRYYNVLAFHAPIENKDLFS